MIHKEFENIKSDKTKALRMKIRGEIQDEEYKLLIEDNSKQLAKLKEEKAKIENILLKHKETIDFKELNQTLEEFVQNPVLDEKMLHKLIERIEIKKMGTRESFTDSRFLICLLFFTSNTQHSTCMVIGNMSTGWTSSVW